MDEALKKVFECAKNPQFIEVDDFALSWCARFSYPMFAQNLALALAVCEDCGVDRNIAVRGMLKALPDPGVRLSAHFTWRGLPVCAVNAFAANDTQSTLELWNRETAERDDLKDFRVLIFNHREDRAWRALQLEEISSAIRADAIFAIGMSERFARRILKKRKNTEQIPIIRVLRASEFDIEAVLETTMTMLQGRTARIAILCAGNIKGPGAALTESIEAMRASVQEMP
jgi:poly-gamma-glutamate synthase PgsB/CapB